MNIGIIGHGFVGKAVEFGFKVYMDEGHQVLIYDKFQDTTPLEEVLEKSDYIFLCLPTPFFEDKLEMDLSIFDESLEEIYPMVKGTKKILIIKSTVVPSTTKKYSEKYPDVSFCFNPEFLTEANYLEDFVFTERIIIGANDFKTCSKVTSLYRSMPHFEKTPILMMGTTEAEVVKYQCNVLLATKVAISNVFYDMCDNLDINYENVKEGVIYDERIGESHVSVTKERGFGGKCFPKDLGAIIGRCKELGIDCKLLNEVYEYNNRIRKVKDWQDIAGATVGGRDYNKEPKEPTALFFRAKKVDGLDGSSNCGGDYFKGDSNE